MSNQLFPLTMRTHGSLLLSQTKPDDIPAICATNNFISAPLTDISSMSQCVNYANSMKKAGLKPVFGTTISVENSQVVYLAKNLAGWKELLYLNFLSNKPENRANPNLTLSDVENLQSDNLVNLVPVELYNRISPGNCCFPSIEIGKKQDCSYNNCVVISPNFFEKSRLFENTIIRCKGEKIQTENYDNSNWNQYIWGRDELNAAGICDEIIDRGLQIYESIEPIDIKVPQKLPEAQCPPGMSQAGYLRQLCFDALAGLQGAINDMSTYRARLEYELSVINSAQMEGYFLIVRDIVDFIRKAGYLAGAGRGSAAGCLMSYLIGITGIDPLKYNLMFERFYTADRGSLPDIDLDMPEAVKDPLIQYMRAKYGETRFMQLCTFSTFKGAAALKTVFTALGGVTPAEQNEITKNLPMESKIMDQLKDQFDELGHKSIVYWTLKNKPNILGAWCELKNDILEGPLAAEFGEAIRLESVISGRGRHASAFVLSNQPIYETCPVMWDVQSNLYISGVDMYGAEDLGVAKIDLLGLNLLTKSQHIRDIVNGTISLLPSTGNW